MSDFDDMDFTNIPISSLMIDTMDDTTLPTKHEDRLSKTVSDVATRVEQYQWVVSWLEKNKLLRTLDTLLDEGADIAAETFESGTAVSETVEVDDFASQQAHSWDVHRGQNILCVRFHPNPDWKLMASGSTDRTVAISNWQTGELVTTIHGAHTAPILSLDWNPVYHDTLVLGSVDNSASVVKFKGLGGPSESVSYDVIARLHAHSKHVVRVQWAPDGKRFATASYDHTAKIFQQTDQEFECIKEIKFDEAVESIAWTPDGKWLIASARADNYLHYFDCENFQEQKFNMNASGDDHVSFTAMDLRVSNDSKHVLVSTDKHRVIMFAIATPLQVRNFYDVPNGEWCTPRAVWNQSGSHIYVSSEDKSIHVYSTNSTKKKLVLTGHTSNIRDLTIHPSLEVIATCSFDKTVKIWEQV